LLLVAIFLIVKKDVWVIARNGLMDELRGGRKERVYGV